MYQGYEMQLIEVMLKLAYVKKPQATHLVAEPMYIDS